MRKKFSLKEIGYAFFSGILLAIELSFFVGGLLLTAAIVLSILFVAATVGHDALQEAAPQLIEWLQSL